MQAGILIQALKLEGRGSDVGFAWMEAWNRSERWRQSLVAGARRLDSEDHGLLTALVAEACAIEGENSTGYGLAVSVADSAR